MMQKIYDQIIKGIKKYCESSGIGRVVLGVSGGIDSSLTLKLAVDALEGKNVTAISMPELGISSQENVFHAKALAEALNATYFHIPINQFLVTFAQTPWGRSTTADINTKARIRAVLLYHYANTTNALVMGTSNRSEAMLGYGTKYGDIACDFMPIGDLFKDEVVALADFVGLPKEIIEKPPSAELYEGQTDETELGASYNELDPILKKFDMGVEKLIEKGMNPTTIHNVFNRVEKNRHKSEVPPVIKVRRTSSSK